MKGNPANPLSVPKVMRFLFMSVLALALLFLMLPENSPSLTEKLPPGAIFCGAEEIVYHDYQWFFTEGKYEFENGATRCDKIARHGKYSAKTDSAHYTAMAITLKDLKPNEGLEVSVWKKNVHGYGYLVADGPWPEIQKIALPDSSDENGWDRLRLNLRIPDSVSSATVKIYVMAKDNFYEPIYFDDLLILKTPVAEKGILRIEDISNPTLLSGFVDVSRIGVSKGMQQVKIENYLPEKVQLAAENGNLLEISPANGKQPGVALYECGTGKKQLNFIFRSLSFEQEIRFLPLSSHPTPRQKLETAEVPRFIQKEKNVWRIPAGTHIIEKVIFIPPGIRLQLDAGCQIDLRKGGGIFSRSPWFSNGTAYQPVLISSADGTGGIAIIQAEKSSLLRHTHFENLNAFAWEGWTLTSGVNFYESDVMMENCRFRHARSEDALNIVRSTFWLKETRIDSCASDGLDVDFGIGRIEHCDFTNTVNDGADFSGSKVVIRQSRSRNNGDKGFSIGEGSRVILENCSVENSQLGIGIKDGSIGKIAYCTFSQCKTALHAEVKKPEFGPAFLLIQAPYAPEWKQNAFSKGGSAIMELAKK